LKVRLHLEHVIFVVELIVYTIRCNVVLLTDDEQGLVGVVEVITNLPCGYTLNTLTTTIWSSI
jgi:hypothetical protein